MPSPDHHLATLSGRRHGIFRIDHADRAGMSRRKVSRMERDGRAFRQYPGVYSLGHAPTSQEATWMAAVDAAGPGAVLAGRAAASLWRIDRGASNGIDVLSPRRARRLAGVRTHESRSLPSDDVTMRDAIPVLRVERLLVELADHHDEGRLCRWIDEARHHRLLNRRRLTRVMARHRNRRGHARLVRALAMLDDGSAGFRSAWEEAVVARIDSPPGITRLVCTRRRIGGRSCEPDLYFPELSIVIQVDGPDHDRPNRRRDDQRLDQDLADAGVTTIRIHWRAEDAGVRRANDEIRTRASHGT